MEKGLGRIQQVRFGIGGYQDCMLGIHFTLGGDGWGVGDCKAAWDPLRIKVDKYTKWTERDRSLQLDEIMRYVSQLLADAKVDSVDSLKGIPIEMEFDGNLLKGWRILKEVL